MIQVSYLQVSYLPPYLPAYPPAFFRWASHRIRH